jgi:hypothetical protein
LEEGAGDAPLLYNDVMKRTTIMADKELLDRLQTIARQEGVSLATVVRQGLELRARQGHARPKSFGVSASSDPPYDTARRADDIDFTPDPWR